MFSSIFTIGYSSAKNGSEQIFIWGYILYPPWAVSELKHPWASAGSIIGVSLGHFCSFYGSTVSSPNYAFEVICIWFIICHLSHNLSSNRYSIKLLILITIQKISQQIIAHVLHQNLLLIFRSIEFLSIVKLFKLNALCRHASREFILAKTHLYLSLMSF